MPAFLVPVDSGQCLIPLEKSIVLIGRQADCDVSLTHSRKISRRHCCIAQVNKKFVVRDLGSTNGVYLNGNRIEKESEIEMGDDLVIGDVRFTLKNEAPVGGKPQERKPKDGSTKGTYAPIEVTPPPPIPAGRRSMALPPVPKPSVQSAQFDDDDDESTSQRPPDTLDGIRRHRSSRR